MPSYLTDVEKLRKSLSHRELIKNSIGSHVQSIRHLTESQPFEIATTTWSDIISNSLRNVVPKIPDGFLASHALEQFKGLSEVLKVGNAYSENISKTLRHSLGDWREPLVIQRAPQSLYSEHGFDSGLTELPTEVFFDVVFDAGLSSSSNDIVLFGPVVKEVDERALDQLQRNTLSYARFYQLETRLRVFINDEMTATHGANWVKVLPKDVKDNLLELQEKKNKNGENRTLVECTDFSHYVKILFKTDLWREVFSPKFGTRRKEDVLESLNRLKPLRDVVMHCNNVSHEDWLMLHFESTRLLSVIGWPQ